MVPEPLFNPGLIGIDKPGLVPSILTSIGKCPADLRAA
eukprot:CAMPEP_0177662292 /NCGR_PEP_ID=MMETSP0447-20121125/19204_1 /TAXON_ID=0 /ORGANISM="Stygamoeba regulata, Strain BSH-02190019" /LENGTH=37 /DNA_ID= /DNA_START= /DNA_END= /DNA_ORIENTATION=